MPAPLIPKDEVSARLFGVFRTYGYEGATLARISEATGLGRASLYHYFPGGKDDMAREVLGVARGWLAQNVVAPLQSAASIHARIKTMLANLREGYSDGSASCVINLLGLGEADEKFHGDVNDTVELWLHALERLLKEAGITPARARRIALDAVVRVEGALVVARALHDKNVFLRTLYELERALSGEIDRA